MDDARGRGKWMRHRLQAGLLAVVLLATGCAADEPTSSAEPTDDAPAATSTAATTTSAAPTTTTPPPPPPPELPGGGRDIFPAYRLVGFSLAPGSPALGGLTGDLDVAAARLEEQAIPYGVDRPVLPVFELIATVVHPVPGADGNYSTRATDENIGNHLDAARRHGALLLLNIQPGTADFLPEVQAYEKWLREPEVGVALDPEWAISPGQIPGEVYGRTTGQELDGVAAYLATLVEEGDLPEKVMVYHQVAPQVVEDEAALREHPGVAAIKSVDGIGSQGAKEATWYRLMETKPAHVTPGFKLFYEEDLRGGPLMTPEQVLALMPLPEYVLYE
ncbi:hypothetical protein BH20ACT5_BH20ACT5_10800 [soil metagenome]